VVIYFKKMNSKMKSKTREWLKRYIPAEILGSIFAVIPAAIVYSHSHSYVAAAAVGWFGEGVGFYGYFIITELFKSGRNYIHLSLFKRIIIAIGAASSNLLVEFAPAEVLDNFIIRPFGMYIVPIYIKPYAVGFLVGKFGADIVFYMFAVIGYESRKHWLHR